MFDAATIAAVDEMAERIKVEPAAMLAVVEVEANGVAFATVEGKPEPLIRGEGHYFDRRLTGAERELARSQGLAHPKAGVVKNPKKQADRWKMLRRMMRINKRAALESISIGVGQVMVAHWHKLGFKSPEEMVAKARESVAGQIELMVRYIDKFGLVDELQRRDFSAFARGYNGPGYKKNAYHTKMARAYERYSGEPAVSAATGMLRMGSRGAKVRELQALLKRAGYAVNVDGDFGPATRDAVRDFQKAQKVTVDGVAGPETFRMLEAFKVAPEEKPGEQAAIEVDEVKQALPAGGVLVMVTQFRDQIAETASYLTGVDAGWAETIANGLLGGAGMLGLGLTAWAIYGMWKSRQTDEGDVLA